MGDGTKENPLTCEDVLRLIAENGGKTEGLDLSGKVFEREIDLREFYLLGIILKKAMLYEAHLERALLAGAKLQEAGLTGAHLEGAILVGANLKGTYLKVTSLQGADLTGANLSRAWLEGAKLSSTTALERVDWGRDYKCGEEASGNFIQEERTYSP
ncbi:pentapeptide repeat-containing protein [Chloroflexota bacterium]